jgi:hypothetical protein
MSAVFNLTEMVEDLLLASGKPRKPLFENLRTVEMQSERPARGLLEIQGQSPVGAQPGPGTGSESVGLALEVRPTDFGTMRRRRRWGGLAVLMTLLFTAALAWAIPAMTSAGNAEPLVPRVANTVNGPPGTPADPGPTVDSKIPDVSGLSLEEAVRIISDAGFEVTDIKTEASQRAQDTAIRTEPAAGAPAKSGTPVVLTMSGGAAPAVQTASATATPTASAPAGYAN